MKYVYPAIFHLDMTDENYPNGVYLIDFPDLEGCYTSGETLEEAFEMAEDALNLMLLDMEERKIPVPAPSFINKIKTEDPNDIVTLVKADTLAYRKMYDNKAIKKTLSIPRWLDTLAHEHGINFSNVLQKALMKELNVSPK